MRIGRLVCCLSLVGLVATGVPADTSTPFSESWIVVRLREPLELRESGRDFALATGRPGIDAAIAEVGVHRIDQGLQVSMRDSRRKEALRSAGFDRVYRFHVPPGTEIRRFVAKLASLPGVEYAEPDHIYRVQGTTVPNDLGFTGQWAFDQTWDADVDGPEAWNVTTGSARKLAVIDTGIDLDHPDLESKIDPGWDFVDDDPAPDDLFNHGAYVASIAAAATNNFTGMAGTCWNCRIVPLKAIDDDGQSLDSRLADALVWAADHGADVINFSAGVESDSQLVLDAIDYVRAAGVVFVAAVGNGGSGIAWPARHPDVIAVGAATSLDMVWQYSRPGRYIDNVAPGDDILGVDNAGAYQTGSGTSMSTPLVVGLAGLIASIHPTVGTDEVRDLINFGAEDQVGLPDEDTPGWDRDHGWGRVNMHTSVLGAQSLTTLHVDGKVNTRSYYGMTNAVATSMTTGMAICWSVPRSTTGRFPAKVGSGCSPEPHPDHRACRSGPRSAAGSTPTSASRWPGSAT